MKANILKLLHCATLVTLAVGLSTATGKAQEQYKGTFTLPFQAQWGPLTLPAGDYTIDLQSSADSFLVVRGEGKSAFLLKGAVSTKPLSDYSQLTIVDVDGHEVITSLEAGPIGFAFNYSVRKSKMKSMQGTLVPVRTVNQSPTRG